jgi:hypothetical protein
VCFQIHINDNLRFKDDCDAKMRSIIFLSRNSKATTERPFDDDLELIQKSADGNEANKTFEWMPISFAVRIPRNAKALHPHVSIVSYAVLLQLRPDIPIECSLLFGEPLVPLPWLVASLLRQRFSDLAAKDWMLLCA